MMNKDWLNDIHDRMTDYEASEPESLWDDIVRAVDSRTAADNANERQSKPATFAAWLSRHRTAAAAAVVAAIAVGTTLRYISNPDSLDSHNTNINIPAPLLASAKSDIAESPRAIAAATCTNVPPARSQLEDAPQCNPEFQSEIIVETISEIAPQVASESSQEIAAATGTDVPAARSQREQQSDAVYAADDDDLFAGTATTEPRFSFAMFTSGGIGNTSSEKSLPSLLAAAPSASAWADDPVLGMMVFNQGREVEKEVKHRLPVRAGLTAAYRLADRFSIETGLLYTNLTSDLRQGSEDHYTAGTQTLHYLGIPVNLKFRIASWERLDLYASAGVLAEKCIDGTLKNEVILDGELQKTEREHLSVKPLQWSVNLAAGLQYNFINTVGIYFEPGINYYFDNSTPIKTIYNDRPFNFNLNVGLRFTFGN